MTEPAPGADSLRDATLAGRYRIERFVARGGFGRVYRAAHVDLGRPVAIKVLAAPEDLGAEARAAFFARFRQEAQTLAALDHPAVVRVLDFGTTLVDGVETPWMAMDWIDGVALDDELVARRGRGGRSPREALALLRGAFEGVAAAHAKGVAHRDLKPANLMRVTGAAEPSLRVLDFGIAKLMHPDDAPGSGYTETQSELTSFTPAYAAPEQLSRARTGPWTDVHALALLVTEVLCDRAPYPGDDPTATHAAAFDPRRPTPATFGVDVGPWERVLRDALSLRPTDRPPDAAALLAALSSTVDAAERAYRGERPQRSGNLRGAFAFALAALAAVATAVALRPSRDPAPTQPPPATVIAPRPSATPERIDSPAPQALPPAPGPSTEGVVADRPTPVLRRVRRPLRAVDAAVAPEAAPAPAPTRIEIE